MRTKVSIDLLKLKCRVTSYKIRCVGLTCASAKVTYSPKWRSRAITPEATDTTANTTASKPRRALEELKERLQTRSQGPLACRDLQKQRSILGDQRADTGGEESLNRRENMAQKKRKERPEELFSLFFTFLRALFFRPFRLSLAPTICAWISEDGRDLHRRDEQASIG